MIDLDHIAIAVVVAALCHRNYATIRRIDRRALSSSNIDAEMPGPVIVAGEIMSVGGPGETSAAHGSTGTGTFVGGGRSRRAGCYSRHQPLYELAFPAGHHHPRAGLYLRVSE